MSEGAGTARPHLSRMSGARNPWLQLQQRHRVLVATSLLFQDRGGVIRLAIIEKPGAARRARMLCGIFLLAHAPDWDCRFRLRIPVGNFGFASL
jgi:hypothetical protein